MWCQRMPQQMWCRSASGAVLHFADVAPLFENGMSPTARPFPNFRHKVMHGTKYIVSKESDLIKRKWMGKRCDRRFEGCHSAKSIIDAGIGGNFLSSSLSRIEIINSFLNTLSPTNGITDCKAINLAVGDFP
ncbi:hypothetical protein Tco_1558703 [Tanacetum coccineum]